ncbi:uncharacterized protein LOC111634848 [Centruroides sculpturatus]|uniref:uncharacterized protein LOC111634848 n=1 Tax=Centruroides sculpturatus TaxID=218467 RepID=UPI000C6DFA14|nr:uncharacterized protein LOC111634848 [Centruroides sculpturatus]
MKIYILFFCTLLICKVACNRNPKLLSKEVCGYSESRKSKIYDCIENNLPAFFKNKVKGFIQCIGRNSLLEIVNMICESNKPEDLKAQYANCFSILELHYDVDYNNAVYFIGMCMPDDE